MATIEREFYRSWRGPGVSDIDAWRLVFDRCSGNLVVRHRWETDHHSGVDDFGIAEFLVEQAAAQSALLTLLFDEAGHACIHINDVRRVECDLRAVAVDDPNIALPG